MNDVTHHKPAVRSEGGRVVIDVAAGDAEELQIHLRSLGIGTAARPDVAGTARLEVVDHGFEEVDAAVGEWEVARFSTAPGGRSADSRGA